MVVNKRGWLGSLLFPIGVAAGIVVIGVPTFMIWNIYSASEARRTEHEAAVARNETVAKTTVARQVADGETQFVLRLVDGKLVRVIADEAVTGAFLNDTILYLDRARSAAHRAAATELDAVFASAFASRSADLASYADWFFDWGRSWRFLYEAVAGAVQEAARLSFSRTQITDAARQAVEAYLLRHYEEFVLKPGLRDQAIVSGVDDVLRRAHDRYLAAVAGLDDRMQRFLAEKNSAMSSSSTHPRSPWRSTGTPKNGRRRASARRIATSSRSAPPPLSAAAPCSVRCCSASFCRSSPARRLR